MRRRSAWCVRAAVVVGAGLVPQLVMAAPLTPSPLVQVSRRDPFAGCTADRPARQPGRVFVRSEVEPYVDVNPADPQNVVGTWQQDRWSNGGARGLVSGVSLDGGATWRRVVIPRLTLCSGGRFERASDPWLSFGPNGDLFHIALAINGNVFSGRASALLVSKSTNGGRSWSRPVTIIRDRGSILNDKESITADPTDPTRVYAAWDRVTRSRAPFWFARSTDGGSTWRRPRKIWDPGPNRGTVGHQIVVQPSGRLIDFFTQFGGRRDGWLSLLRSPDDGVTWRPARFPLRVALLDSEGVFDPESGSFLRTGAGLADVAVDPASGALYAVWQDGRFTRFRGDSIAFSMSLDGGVKWSRPIKVNRTPSGIRRANRQAFLPSLAVADDGTVGVSYYDFRHNNRRRSLRTDHFLVHCHAACSRRRAWGDEVRVTNRPFDLRRAPLAFGRFVGDYQGLATAGNDFLAFFSQTHELDPASIFFRRAAPAPPASREHGGS